MITLDDLIRPVTLSEAKASIYTVAAALELPVTAWKPKAVVRAFVWVFAALMVAVSTLVVLVVKSGFREYAEGDWLTVHAKQTVGIDRVEATFAAGTFTLDNAGGSLFNMGIGEVLVDDTATGAKVYRNTQAFTLSPMQTGLQVTFEAVEAGSGSSASAGEIDHLQTTMSDVTISNDDALVGLDAESDVELRAREVATLDALSPNGPAGAYYAAAVGATRADGSNVAVNRVKVNATSSTGEVVCVVATASGVVTGTVGTPGDDLDYVNIAVQTKAVPLGIAGCTVVSAAAVSVAATFELWCYDTGLEDTVLEAYAKAALDKHITTRPIGGDDGYVYVDMLIAALRGMRSDSIDDATAKAISDKIYKVVVTLPAADVALTSTQVATAGTHTCTGVHQVAA